ncbi:protein ninY [Enterobacter sp. R1(2018)]|nr:protein ninY [Enterobacter sp. R1(2018)]
MSTAAVFDDVVYPMHFDSPSQVKQEVEGAVSWFCNWCNEEKAVVKANMLVSCWGLYLSHDEVILEAA